MKGPARLLAFFALAASPAFAQGMAGMDMGAMPGMAMPKPAKPAPRKKATPKPAAAPAQPAAPQPAPVMAMPMAEPAPAAVPTSPAQPMPGMAMGGDGANSDMSSMDMPGMPGMKMTSSLGSYPMARDASGTSWQPDLAEHHGLHVMAGDWQVMAHGMLWGLYDTQSGPRGGDKTYAAGMLMGMASRDLEAGGTLGLRAMLSPDPLMGKSGYPLLLATGETANGSAPLVDRQHPHDLVMELSGSYSRKLSADSSVFLYAGYPGEPALGLPAFMHRASGMDIPQAPITHHWLDSTHITFGVVTGGFVQDSWKLEVSRFTGREPDQDRYDFDRAKFDSTSVRASYNPDEHWSLQASWGFLKSPEQLEPLVDENRYTASASYVTKLGDASSLAATLGWGQKDLSDGHRLNGAFLETEYKPSAHWTGFARAEWEQNAELDAAHRVRAVGDVTLGGIHDRDIADHVRFGVGASYTFDSVPSGVAPSYGSDPHGALLFTRLTLD